MNTVVQYFMFGFINSWIINKQKCMINITPIVISPQTSKSHSPGSLEDRLSLSRSLSPTRPLNTSSFNSSLDQELCTTCKCRHSNPQKLCPVCNCVHRSPSSSGGVSDVCPVCYNKYSKCPRSPRNVTFSEYSPVLADLSRTFWGEICHRFWLGWVKMIVSGC